MPLWEFDLSTLTAGAYFAAVWQVHCDLAWHPQWLLLPGHNGKLPCQLCMSSRENLFQPRRQTHPNIMSPLEWKARFTIIPRTISLWKVPGLTGLHLNPDIMHQALTNICWAVSWQFCWSTNMTVNCTSYVKSRHRALSAMILYI